MVNGIGIDASVIERLVRMVMADMGLAVGETAPAAPKSSEAPIESPSERAAESTDDGPADVTELRLTSHVVSLEQIRGAMSPALQRLVVPQGAVVTPSVRDELKKRGWQLVFDGASLPAPCPALTGSLEGNGLYTLSASNAALRPVSGTQFGVSRQTGVVAPIDTLVAAFHALPAETLPTSFFDSLGKTAPVEIYRNRCVVETAEFLAERLAIETSKGFLITRYTAAASAVSNRKRALRAIIGTAPDRLDEDALSIGANLLILDPSLGVYRIRQMVIRFAELGKASCTAILRKGLEP
jgi:hypothetical protein